MWAAGALYNNTSDEALPISLFRTMGAMDLDNLWDGFMQNTGLMAGALVQYMDDQFGRGLSVSFMANQVPWKNNYIRLSDVRDKWNRKSAWVVKDWHPHDGHLILRIDPREDGEPLRLDVHSLKEALAEAERLLTS